MPSPISVDIFGSCVSRDCFSLIDQNVLTVGQYIARQSFLSSIEKPIELPCSIEDIKLSSEFQKRTMVCDLQKTAFEKLGGGDEKFPWLVLDFIDERFQIGRIQNSLFTRSMEFLNSGIFPNYETVEYGWSSEKCALQLDGEPVDERFSRFAERLDALYPNEHIILHAATFVDYYIDRSTGQILRFDDSVLRTNEAQNEKLHALFALSKRYLNNLSACLDYTNDYCADTSHQWGLAPCHYQPEYYRRLADDILRICQRQVPPHSSFVQFHHQKRTPRANLSISAETKSQPTKLKSLLQKAIHRN
jgi:hypothetical protein